MERMSTFIGTAARAGLVAAAIASAMAGPALAQRVDTRYAGNSSGGLPFRHECAPGSYLVGLNARGGAWIDAIGAVCQRWNPATRSFDGPDQAFDVAGGSGGSPQVARCLPNAAISGGMTQMGHNQDNSLVYLRANCRRIDMPDQQFQSYAAGRAYFGEVHTTRIGVWFSPRPTECPAGMWAVGIYGRAGAFVDSMGFICEPGPSLAAPTPAIRQNTPDRAIQPSQTIPRTLNPSVRSLGCPLGTVPRRDAAGQMICGLR